MDETKESEERSDAWRRALALFVAVLGMSVVQPTLLVALPFLVFVVLRGIRGTGVFFATLLAVVVVMTGPRDGTWYVERAWALMVGGIFAAVSLARPTWRLTSRTLLAVGVTAGVWVLIMVVRTDAWAAVDWVVTDELHAAYVTWLDVMRTVREGEVVSPAFASAIYRTVEMQVSVFPALVALESMAALAVAWWLYARLYRTGETSIGPLGGFRFNDHLVWVMIVGLLLVGIRTVDPVSRLGANLAVFMGALYALRGMGVVVSVSGGLSLFGYGLLALGILFAAPVVIGFAALFGIADTWLDLRARVGSAAT
ncbi:MAG: hypothetical protein R3304_04240 [Longimicrobiales bacterium]|nr:hypothetical protein [Longimicrobiales bacterium]